MNRFRNSKDFFRTAMNINVIYSILADKKVFANYKFSLKKWYIQRTFDEKKYIKIIVLIR